MEVSSERPRVPWRTIWATIASVLVAAGGVLVLGQLRHLLVWLVVSLFFTVALAPGVDGLVRRFRWRRGLAVTVVMVVALVVLVGLIVAFVRPLVTEGQRFADQAPKFLRENTGPSTRW